MINEKKLNRLFDYQKFEQNTKLAKMIDEAENRYSNELSDDFLEYVNAAGDFTMSGGTISGNTSQNNGGGVYVSNEWGKGQLGEIMRPHNDSEEE